MAGKFKANDAAFFVVSNREIREVKVLKSRGDMYTIRFVKGGGGLTVRESRLFTTPEEARASLPKEKPHQSVYYHSPWD